MYAYYRIHTIPAMRRCRRVAAVPPATPVESRGYFAISVSILTATSISIYIYLSIYLSIYLYPYLYLYICMYAYYRKQTIPAMRRYRHIIAAPPAAPVESRGVFPLSLSLCRQQ